MPESDSSSWMSSSRHGAPLSWYSESPARNKVRVIVTSENSMGSNPAELSMVSETSARPSAGRSGVPAKMTSSILPPRSVRGPCAPSTHATASTRSDLPEPFGPTTTVTPGSNSRTVLSAKDLKPRRVSDFRNTRAAPRYRREVDWGWRARERRSYHADRSETIPDPAASPHVEARLPHRGLLVRFHPVDGQRQT